MYRYDRNNGNADRFDWEEEGECEFLSQRFEESSGRKTNKCKVDTRRRVEDHQEKRRLRKRVRLSIDSWDDVG